MNYRSEIDGLRALAVVPVILFHAGFHVFSGGFVGVDVFFVISGFLITTILIEDLENNRFSLIQFYERRARRILPALFAVMLACIPFAWLWMLPSQIEAFSKSLVAVSLFASNILFWQESDYFATVADEKPLLHTWSLAVEEQYYLLFPIFLLLTWRFGRNKVFWLLVVIATGSLVLSQWASRAFPTANFYLSPTRAWELVAGSLAAIVVVKQGLRPSNLLAAIGLLAIIFAILFFNEQTPFPGVFAIVPVAGTALILLFADKSTWVAKLLSNRAIVGIGLVSYSAYLWHQPLFAFARITSFNKPSVLLTSVLVLLTMLLAYLSWRFIEKPFRNKGRISAQYIWLLTFLGLAFFIAVGVYGNKHFKTLNSGQHNPLGNKLLGNYNRDNPYLQKESWKILSDISSVPDYDVEDNIFDSTLWFTDDEPNRKILLLGNSHSNDIFNILFQSEDFITSSQLARFGAQIKDVNANHRFWESPNYVAATHILIVSRYSKADLSALPYVVERVQADDKAIIIVDHVFEFPGEAHGYNLIDEIVRDKNNEDLDMTSMANLVNESYYEYYKTQNKNYSFSINSELQSIAKKHNVTLLNRMDYICSDALKICDAIQPDLTKNFFDYGHHTLPGSAHFAKSPVIQQWVIAFDE